MKNAVGVLAAGGGSVLLTKTNPHPMMPSGILQGIEVGAFSDEINLCPISPLFLLEGKEIFEY